MTKRLTALLLLLGVVCCLFAACGDKQEPLTAADAIRIVQEDLGENSAQEPPHVHSGTFEGKECFFVYVTADGKTLAYAVHSVTGEILDISESGHSH